MAGTATRTISLRYERIEINVRPAHSDKKAMVSAVTPHLMPLRANPATKYRWNTRKTIAIGTTLSSAYAIVAP